MGRYYNGDINGKFGFGCQSSDDGEYFGAVEDGEPNILHYYIPADEFPNAIDKLSALISDFNINAQPKEKLTLGTDEDKFWDIMRDNAHWTSLKGNNLKMYRMNMGYEIYRHAKESPNDWIYFDAEL